MALTTSYEVVIASGSYHTPEPYQPFVDFLAAQGVKAHCPQLPTSDLTKLNISDPANPDYDNPPPPQGYPQPAEDAFVLNQVINQIVSQGKYVVVIGHSSGGFAAAYVTEPELQARVRKAKGQTGGILGIFFECAFLIPPNDSVHTFFQPKDGSQAVIPPFNVVHVSPINSKPARRIEYCAELYSETWFRWPFVHQGSSQIFL